MAVDLWHFLTPEKQAEAMTQFSRVYQEARVTGYSFMRIGLDETVVVRWSEPQDDPQSWSPRYLVPNHLRTPEIEAAGFEPSHRAPDQHSGTWCTVWKLREEG